MSCTIRIKRAFVAELKAKGKPELADKESKGNPTDITDCCVLDSDPKGSEPFGSI